MESTLQRKILRDLDSLGKYCVAFKIRKSSVDGTPDIFFTTLKTGGVFIEVKDENGIQSEAQKQMIKNIYDCGTKAFVIWSWGEWVSLKRSLRL